MALRSAARGIRPWARSPRSFTDSESHHQLRYASTRSGAGTAQSMNQTAHQIDPTLDSPSAAFVAQRAPFMVPTYVRPPPVIDSGKGCYLWDIEQRKYLDFTAGIAVTSLGHSDPGVAEIVSQQSRMLIHSSNLFHNKWTGTLSQLLVTYTVESGAMRGAKQAFICNSGTEANEAAIKFSRKVGHSLDPSGAKHEFVSFFNSFHGRTYGALSATPNPKYQAPFAPMVPGFKYGTYNDIAQLQTLITEKTCGVIVEPIQGEGGVHTATPEFLSALRARCDEVGAVLIFDEIQCGLSRTGSLWAHAHPTLEPKDDSPAAHPDILTTAKALGNGIPIGATIISDKVSQHIRVGDHGTTFGGNPFACRIGQHVLTRLASSALQSSVRSRSTTFRSGLEHLRKRFPDAVEDIRGCGLLLGLQLTEKYKGIVGDITNEARERGLLVITAGDGCLRFVPPLIITDEEIREGLSILGEAMEHVFARTA
ncbi:acetylornithine aminotransferase [Histoplasma capsulatum]|uniref:acetylornithine transaminase n=1 Tax=Ajellomyces capsulatus TaxID=5037 RepID=A0A8A1M5G9_AJECA|nr:acetylornithine aminotransferase, mitochondrial precursor [Histoplasma mississippiense (nom. inval.)]EDN07270.1 acetylornithine aminotransferase, mitochondrial precursor [Histoplasma mississippiense (nom. inval.)]QSS61289.1 acetylornithine aminotransferase [Histoplasma capsulatum]